MATPFEYTLGLVLEANGDTSEEKDEHFSKHYKQTMPSSVSVESMHELLSTPKAGPVNEDILIRLHDHLLPNEHRVVAIDRGLVQAVVRLFPRCADWRTRVMLVKLLQRLVTVRSGREVLINQVPVDTLLAILKDEVADVREAACHFFSELSSFTNTTKYLLKDGLTVAQLSELFLSDSGPNIVLAAIPAITNLRKYDRNMGQQTLRNLVWLLKAHEAARDKAMLSITKCMLSCMAHVTCQHMQRDLAIIEGLPDVLALYINPEHIYGPGTGEEDHLRLHPVHVALRQRTLLALATLSFLTTSPAGKRAVIDHNNLITYLCTNASQSVFPNIRANAINAIRNVSRHTKGLLLLGRDLLRHTSAANIRSVLGDKATVKLLEHTLLSASKAVQGYAVSLLHLFTEDDVGCKAALNCLEVISKLCSILIRPALYDSVDRESAECLARLCSSNSVLLTQLKGYMEHHPELVMAIQRYPNAFNQLNSVIDMDPFMQKLNRALDKGLLKDFVAQQKSVAKAAWVSVNVLRGRHIVRLDADSASDAYVEVVVGDSSSATQTVFDNANPVWGEEFYFCCLREQQQAASSSSSSIVPEMARLRVRDYDEHSADDLVGDCNVPLGNLLDQARKSKDGKASIKQWLPIKIKKGQGIVESGELHVEVMVMLPDPARANTTTSDSTTSAKKKNDSSSHSPAVADSKVLEHKEQKQQSPSLVDTPHQVKRLIGQPVEVPSDDDDNSYHLSVNVIEAIEIHRPGGADDEEPPNTFCRIKVGDLSQDTREVKSSFSPEWMSNLEFAIPKENGQPQHVTCEVWERQGGKESLIGKCVTNIAQVWADVTVAPYMELYNKRENVGQVLLRIEQAW